MSDKGFKVTDRRGGETEPAESEQRNTQDPTPEATPEAPEIDFSTFLLSLSASALMHLGATPDGQQGEVNLVLAKQTIDCISLMEEKTKGNLNGEEERLLSAMLYDLRLRYVAAAKKDE